MSRPWRIDPVLVTVSGLAFGAFACVARLATLAVAAACLLLWRKQLRLRQLSWGALAVAIGWGRASWQLRSFEVDAARAREFVSAPAPCAVSGRVLSSPVVRAGLVSFDAELWAADCNGRQAQWPLRARLFGGPRDGARGDTFSAIAKLAPVSAFRNFSLPDPLPGLARHAAVVRGSVLWFERDRAAGGLLAGVDRWRASVRERIEATYSAPARGMGRALVLGESDLEAEEEAAFRKSGLAHLLAVSGTHLVFAVLGVLEGLEALLRRFEWLAVRWDVRRAGALVGLVLAPLYADFAGGSGSAWRAAFMLLVVLGGRAVGRQVLPSRVIACSLGLGWCSDGLVVFDPSFLLSLAATLGLLLASRAFARPHSVTAAELSVPRRVELGKLFNRVGAAAVASIAASAPCVPILLLLSPGLSLASVAANLLAAPLGEVVALPLCLTHVIALPWPPLERGLGLAASGALLLIREIAELTASVDWLFLELPPPSCWHVATLAIGAAGLLGSSAQAWLGGAPPGQRCADWVVAIWLAVALAAFALVEVGTRREHSAARWRELGRLRVNVLDVGQGDASLIDLPDGRLMLIDAGGLPGSSVDPGERVLVPTLRARRRSRLDLVVLTHPHPDHFGGLFALTRAVSIGELWYGGSVEVGSELGRLFAELRLEGVLLRSAAELCGSPLVARGYAIDVLGPCPGVAPEQSANDNSLVVRIRVGAQAALFMGDAERWAEARLLERRPTDLSAEFLKVGHHGSRSSSTAGFIASVQPRVAVVSCGVGNRFGHPHPEPLATLAAAGALTLRVDELGSVEWQTDGSHWSVRSWCR